MHATCHLNPYRTLSISNIMLYAPMSVPCNIHAVCPYVCAVHYTCCMPLCALHYTCCMPLCALHYTCPVRRIVRHTGWTESAEFLITQLYVMLLSKCITATTMLLLLLCDCHHHVTVTTVLLSLLCYGHHSVTITTMLLSPLCYCDHRITITTVIVTTVLLLSLSIWFFSFLWKKCKIIVR
jgi:hypothetical protein